MITDGEVEQSMASGHDSPARKAAGGRPVLAYRVGNEEIIEKSNRVLMQNYRRAPVAIVSGQGTMVWDADGRSYLDFTSGIAVNALGHAHPRVVGAVQEQVARLLHSSNLFYTEPQVTLAEKLVRLSGLDRVFFCNDGAGANEAALKLARRYFYQRGEDRWEVISLEGSFHGRTMGALSATGQPKYQQGFAPLVPGFTYVPREDLTALERAITPRTCAVIMEPVQGEGGVYPLSPEYLRGAEEICRRHGVLFILDEVQTGLGRTGRMFAFEHAGVRPDIITLAKALGGGLPLGAVLAREEVAAALTPGTHATTFGGNPVACAAGNAVLTVLEKEKLSQRAAAMGERLRIRLAEMAQHLPIREVRGLGLMLGVDLDVSAPVVVEKARLKGLLINGLSERTIRLLPPLTVSEAEVEEAMRILEVALTETAAEGREQV